MLYVGCQSRSILVLRYVMLYTLHVFRYGARAPLAAGPPSRSSFSTRSLYLALGSDATLYLAASLFEICLEMKDLLFAII